MSSDTKTLTIKTGNNLGKYATIVLIFGDASDGLYINKFPVVRKVAEFGPSRRNHVTATFSSQLAWLKPVIAMDSDSIVGASAYTPINYNQKTTLQQDDNGVFSFTTPEAGTPDSVTVVNGTNNSQDIALGFLPQGALTPVPVCYWSGLGSSEGIDTDFQPILRAYVHVPWIECKEGQIVRGENPTPTFEQDLSILDDNTTWDLKFDAATGRFSITQV